MGTGGAIGLTTGTGGLPIETGPGIGLPTGYAPIGAYPGIGAIPTIGLGFVTAFPIAAIVPTVAAAAATPNAPLAIAFKVFPLRAGCCPCCWDHYLILDFVLQLLLLQILHYFN